MLHTPINKTFKFGELFNIRNRYYNMSGKIADKEFESHIVESVISNMDKEGKIERLRDIRTKNRNLANVMQKNFVTEAIDCVINERKVKITESFKNRLNRSVYTTVDNLIGECKEIDLGLPIAKPHKQRKSNQSGRLVIEDDSSDIDSLIYSICEKAEKEYDSDSEQSILKKYIGKVTVHNYSIGKIVLESIASNKQKTEFIKPTTIYESDISEENTVNNGDIDELVKKMNSLCGFNFTDADYKWFSCGRPKPFFKASTCVTTDMLKGNNLLETYFGKDGVYGDVLFKANGEYRDVDIKKDKIESDVNDLHEYPILNIYFQVRSWDVINGQDIMRDIERDDFDGSNILFVE